MSVLNRRGKMLISRELYEDDKVDNFLFGLKVKVFKVEYEPFNERYTIYFTSTFIDEIAYDAEPQQYVIEATGYGFYFKKNNIKQE